MTSPTKVELVDRLRELGETYNLGRGGPTGQLLNEAADEIERLRVALEAPHGMTEARLREALLGLVQAVEMDAHENNSISGYTGARLSDARDALATQAYECRKCGKGIEEMRADPVCKAIPWR